MELSIEDGKYLRWFGFELGQKKTEKINYFAVSSNYRYCSEILSEIFDSLSKVNDAVMKRNSARGANTMEFPIGKFAGGANTMVKIIDS